METFMDWHLNYRSKAEVERFSDEIEPEEIKDLRMYKDPLGNVIYLEITKM
jgi:extracellular factor (EF) 3-hydroxypalmitic acid methyl ester biosynthesis protein